ncbi:putative ribonuclease H-like domain-containing protein [Tanacetum coccineum]
MNVSHDEPEPSCDSEKKDDEGVSKASVVDNQERPESSTPNINTAGPSINTASANLTTGSLHINTVSPTVITTRSNHSQSILDNPNGLPKLLSDSAWVKVMQEELLQFKLQKVWVLVDLSKGKRAIGTKWIFRNKNDERGIVIMSKARLIEEEMSSMGELTFFLGLQVKQKEDGIFISQDKYVTDILKKFGFQDVRTASTPMDTKKPLLKDSDGDDVDVYLYKSMIGSLMYLTSSRLDIIDSPFDLVAYSDSDYVGASLDRKSTTRVLFEERLLMLICSQAWMEGNVGDEAVHKELGDRMERAATTPSSLKAEQDSDAQTRFEAASKQSNDPPLSRVNTLGSGDGSMKLIKLMAHCTTLSELLQALVDKKRVILTESSIRSDLYLDDAESIDCLPTATICEELARIGVGKDYSGRITPLFDTMMVQASEEVGEDSDHLTDSTQIPTINQPSTSSQPKKKRTSKKTQRKE